MTARMVTVVVRRLGRGEVARFDTEVDPDDGQALTEVLRNAATKDRPGPRPLGEYDMDIRRPGGGALIRKFKASS